MATQTQTLAERARGWEEWGTMKTICGEIFGYVIRHPGENAPMRYVIGDDPDELMRKYFEGFNPVCALVRIDMLVEERVKDDVWDELARDLDEVRSQGHREGFRMAQGDLERLIARGRTLERLVSVADQLLDAAKKQGAARAMGKPEDVRRFTILLGEACRNYEMSRAEDEHTIVGV